MTVGRAVLAGEINAVGMAGEVGGMLHAVIASKKIQRVKRMKNNMALRRIRCIVNGLVDFTKILHRQNHPYTTILYIMEKESNMKQSFIALIVVSILSLACGFTLPPRVAATQPPPPIELTPQVEIPNTDTNPAAGQDTTFNVTNPSSGAALYMAIYYPENWDGQTKLPALVLVPGGSGDSSGFVKQNPAGASMVSNINEAGFAAIIFDPDGRGKSKGTEDYDGFIQQDGLAEVIRKAAALPGVDSSQIGLVTFSFGITMGSGALARHPDLPVKFLIDWEGPASRDDTGGCDSAGIGHLNKVATCTDEPFWAEREASTFISQVRVPYQRIQSEKDHVQPDYAHTVLMINNAVQGGVPWVRLNDEAPNQTYNLDSLPRMLPENMDKRRDQLIVKYAQELFGQ